MQQKSEKEKLGQPNVWEYEVALKPSGKLALIEHSVKD